MNFKYFAIYLSTLIKLGFKNILLVARYRILKKSHLYQLFSPKYKCPEPDCIHSKEKKNTILYNYDNKTIQDANDILNGKFTFFSGVSFIIGCPPNWFRDPFNNFRILNDEFSHWSQVKIHSNLDIKNIWEISRWSWAPLLARAWKMTGDNRYLETLNKLSTSWCKSNPVNQGANWTCGQEISIRLIHALQAWQVIDSDLNRIPVNSSGRVSFVIEHIKRILLTRKYAESQNNNHWTSEAAALFIGGEWLGQKKIANQGRLALEESVRELIMSDGSFAQHSLNYHRLLLDTLNQVEIWRKRLSLKPFSINYYSKVKLAIEWFNLFIDQTSGDGPNLGGNDGAYCYQLHSEKYRDFRPTLQLSCILFDSKIPPPSGAWDQQLIFFDDIIIKNNNNNNNNNISNRQNNSISILADGGYFILRSNPNSWGLLRLPKYKFRPANLDLLHFDLWHNGINILRDSGSYSYNCNQILLDYFQGIKSHNSVQFDECEPMPRISRFLFGNTLKTKPIYEPITEKGCFSVIGSYECPYGKHKRKIIFNSLKCEWTVNDYISKFKKNAIIRWHLCKGNWALSGNLLISDLATIKIISKCSKNVKIKLEESWESLIYNHKIKRSVLHIQVNPPATLIKTKIQFN